MTAETKTVDCVVIGYNETPPQTYLGMLSERGEDHPAYRDLKASLLQLDGRWMTYMDLLDHVIAGHAGMAQRPLRSGDMLNLAAVCLSEHLRRKDLSTQIINLFQVEKERLAAVIATKPACIAITTTFYVIDTPVREMIGFLRACDPDIPIVLGGPLVQNLVRGLSPAQLDATLLEIGADLYVLDADGSQTLAAVLQALKDGTPLNTLPNLALRGSSTMHHTPRRPENNPMRGAGTDWRAIARRYDVGPALQMRTARSCAFACAFCGYPARAGKLTLADLDTVAAELDSARDIGATHIVFIDDTFNVPLRRFKDLCRIMIARDYGFHWFSYLRCSNVDEEAVDLLARAGCEGVFLGIESTAPPVLERMNKVATPERYERGIAWLKARGILTFGSFIVGFPGETEDTVRQSAEFIRRTGLDYWRAQLWYYDTQTPIAAQADQVGLTGSGFDWRHDTMDSALAMDLLEEMVFDIGPERWLPQWSFDFWALPYLLARGLSRDQIRRFLALANARQVLEMEGTPPDDPAMTHNSRALHAFGRQVTLRQRREAAE